MTRPEAAASADRSHGAASAVSVLLFVLLVGSAGAQAMPVAAHAQGIVAEGIVDELCARSRRAAHSVERQACAVMPADQPRPLGRPLSGAPSRRIHRRELPPIAAP